MTSIVFKEIDGVDVREMNIRHLRENMTLVGQVQRNFKAFIETNCKHKDNTFTHKEQQFSLQNVLFFHFLVSAAISKTQV